MKPSLTWAVEDSERLACDGGGHLHAADRPFHGGGQLDTGGRNAPVPVQHIGPAAVEEEQRLEVPLQRLALLLEEVHDGGGRPAPDAEAMG